MSARTAAFEGIFLILLSYTAFLLPQPFTKITSLIVGASFYLGVLMLANGYMYSSSRLSLTHAIFSRRERLLFWVVCLCMGAFFGFVVADLGGLWYFPYWSTSDYAFVGFFLGGWVFYILTLIAAYEATKLLFDHYLKTKQVTRYYHIEKYLYPFCGVVGMLLLAVVAFAAIRATHFFTVFEYSVNRAKAPYLTWEYWLLAFVGACFVCEYVEYRRKRSSLLKDTLHGYLSPLAAAVLVDLVLGVANEVQNQAIYLWRYANYPLANESVFHIPLFILLTWPLHIIFFLEMWRAFGGSSSRILFANHSSR